MYLLDRSTWHALRALVCAILLAACSDGSAETNSSKEPSGDDGDDDAQDEDDAKDGADAGPGRPNDRPPQDAARPSSRDAASADAKVSSERPPTAHDAATSVDADTNDASSSASDAAQAPAVTCPSTKLTPGTHEDSVDFGGHKRTFLLQVPKGYAGDKAVPLIFDFHGYGQSVSSQRGASGFSALGDQHGFAVVYPAGVGGSWHVNGCCGQAAQEKLDEVGAVRAVLEQIESKLCVDPKRVYASGISQGGGMAHHVGCLAADVFAAVAPVSSDLRTEPCTPSRPVSELSFRGMADTLSAYEGGPVGPAGMQYQSIGAKPTLERWKSINRCMGQSKKTNEYCETYSECAAGTEVTLCSLPRGGHGLYSNPERFNLAQFAWEMFERQRLP